MKNEEISSLKVLQRTDVNNGDELNVKFINLFTHDLRGPFATVLGLLSLVKTFVKNGKLEESQEFLDLAHQSASQALILLNNMALWAIEQNGEIKFNPSLIDIRKILYDEIKYIEATAKLKNITVIDNITAEKYVLADKEMVKAIVRNLMNNALKFSFPKGEIIISLYSKDTYVEVSIKDNGKGISRNRQKELFSGNNCHETYGTKKEKGSGRGLMMCKEFLDLHGGELKVESTLGKGSDFRFILPLRPYLPN